MPRISTGENWTLRRHDLKVAIPKVTFSNTRARFQRLEDAKLFNGWVNSLTSKGVIVALSSPLQAQPGEKFRFEVFGTGAVAIFEARLEIVSGTLAAFVLASSIKTLPSQEEMRLRAKDMHATVFLVPNADFEFGIPELDLTAKQPPQRPFCDGEVIDISSKGLGMYINTPVSRGELFRIVIETPWGNTEGTAEVRYCKPEDDRYRLGLFFTSMDRLNRGLYERLLKRSAST